VCNLAPATHPCCLNALASFIRSTEKGTNEIQYNTSQSTRQLHYKFSRMLDYVKSFTTVQKTEVDLHLPDITAGRMTARAGVAFAPRSRFGRAARRRWRADGRGGALGPRRAHTMARLLAPPRLDPREVPLLHAAPLVVGGGGEGSGLLHRELQHPHPRHLTLRPAPNRGGEEKPREVAGDAPSRSDAAAAEKLPSFRLIALRPPKVSAPPTRNQPTGTGATRPEPPSPRETGPPPPAASERAMRASGTEGRRRERGFGFSKRGDSGRAARSGDAS
jgi:hypothetical protein